MADIDYEALVDQTVDEVKEAVSEQDVDIDNVIAAEQADRDRVTLLDWLEEQRTDTASDTDDADDDPLPGTPPIKNRGAVFAGGVLLGAVLVAALLMTGVASLPGASTPTGQIAAAPTQDAVQSYLDENRAALRLPPSADVTVTEMQQHPGTGLYQLTIAISATIQNRTIDQDIPAFVTADGRFLFLTQPLDTSQSVEAQMRQAPPTQ